LEPLSHCLAHTQCRLVILDPERAERLQDVVSRMYQETDVEAMLVFDLKDSRPIWEGMRYFEETLREYFSDGMHILTSPVSILPEDDATLIFTSGGSMFVTRP
jgi:long-subunit acyl-CoA synthetase (AMP-forming)